MTLFDVEPAACDEPSPITRSRGKLMQQPDNPMHFSHSPDLWRDFPQLTAGVIHATGVTHNSAVSSVVDSAVDAAIHRYNALATARLAGAAESELPEIQAWRRTFGRLGLKPTQYRCASESLLRRFRKEGSLPAIHPLVDLCNAVSLAFAIPIAVFDLDRVARSLEVRRASGAETYQAFSGEEEHPELGEVVFVDEAMRAHARRWTNRQSAWSAVQPETREVLIVAEALHEAASHDIARLVESLTGELRAIGCTVQKTALLSAAAPQFVF
jgi:DNA/RNA-binding domain of Phe-tRNA-synthetase-like protein